jgi:hypothetical protein
MDYATLSDIYEILSDENKLSNIIDYAKNLIKIKSNKTETYANELKLAVLIFLERITQVSTKGQKPLLRANL